MKRFFKYLFAIVVLSVAWAGVVLYGTLNGWWHKPILKSWDPALFTGAVNDQFKTAFVGNFSMAIMKDGKVEQEIFHSNNKPVNRNTIFQVSSMSKFVTAVGVMKLAESGKIHLDTPVSRYLKRWQLPPSKFDNEQVTVRRLLSHTAGLTDGLGYGGFVHKDSVQTLEASLTKAKDADRVVSGEVKVGLEPDSRWKYSGGGYTLLQLVIEETSGQSFNAYMTDHLLRPLNMHSSSYVLPDSLNNRLCEFYDADKKPAPHFYYTSLAATSFYSSLADLELFFQFFLKGQNGEPAGRGVVQPATLKAMRAPHWDMMGEKLFGLGCMLYIDIENNEDIFGHDGRSTPPINTAIRINPVTGDGIIVLETGNPDLATKIASDWVFLKTGKVDTLLFTTQLGKMITILLPGVLFITAIAIWTSIRRKKRRQSAQQATTLSVV
jgi:CubicO group peptidase (beta-lactamase class C family)